MISPISRRIAAALEICAALLLVVVLWLADVMLAGPWWMATMPYGMIILAIVCVIHAGVIRDWRQ